MNRDFIKYIAALTMLINHIGIIFLPSPVSEICIDIGFFTAVTMCFFLVEGYRYTRSKKRYGMRLFIFGLISQIPYMFAFSEGSQLQWTNLNMICNLFICFLLIHVMHILPPGDKRSICMAVLVCGSALCDWSCLAPFFVLLFLNAGEDREKMIRAWVISALLIGVEEFIDGFSKMPFSSNLLSGFGAMIGPALAGCCILFFYNGKKARHFQAFHKYFFYIFYPLHLLVLGFLRLCFC